MNTITKIVVVVSLCLMVNKAHAQDTIQNTIKTNKIENLEQLKQAVTNEEKDFLKSEVEVINQRLEKGEITKEKAEELKQEAATKRALNIENRLAIIYNQIALLKRNDDSYQNTGEDKNAFMISFGKKNGLYINNKHNSPKYDLRTGNQLLFAIGSNNTMIDGQSMDDSPYEIGGSGFVELGWIWNTRVLKNSNFIRVNYGLSLQWNKLSIKDNLYFVENGDITTLEEFPLDLKKSKFRTTSLVVPVHFEFGPSEKKDYDDRIRYFNDSQFKIGLGGFAGVNLSAQQKLKYKEDGDNQKDIMKTDFNTTNFVYGLSAYIGVGDFSIYAKYNLNELFKHQPVEQHNVSLGLRWDLD
ncbi:MAG: hypothetical protein ABIO60_09840 [Aquaticitalea sp.]